MTDCRVCRSISGEARISSGPPIFDGRYWMLEHAYPTRLPGWLVIVLKRHVEALHELTADEFQELAAIQHRAARALRQVVGCAKEYIACFAEMDGFAHLHIHLATQSNKDKAMQSNLEEYVYPDLYDLENDDPEPERTFFLELARRFDGPALELGCGTGRITIPLARAGVDITGLDIAPGMLALARQKAQGLPIAWIEADARRYSLPRRFRLIFECGSVFMHMLERADQQAFLPNAHAHLDDGGALVFSVQFPHLDHLTDVETEQDWFSYEDARGRTVRVSGIEKYDPLQQVKIETAFRRWTEADGREVCHVAPLALRYTFPQEMDLLLQTCGFRIAERYGGADFSPLTEKSRFMVFVCMKATSGDAAAVALD